MSKIYRFLSYKPELKIYEKLLLITAIYISTSNCLYFTGIIHHKYYDFYGKNVEDYILTNLTASLVAIAIAIYLSHFVKKNNKTRKKIYLYSNIQTVIFISVVSLPVGVIEAIFRGLATPAASFGFFFEAIEDSYQTLPWLSAVHSAAISYMFFGLVNNTWLRQRKLNKVIENKKPLSERLEKESVSGFIENYANRKSQRLARRYVEIPLTDQEKKEKIDHINKAHKINEDRAKNVGWFEYRKVKKEYKNAVRVYQRDYVNAMREGKEPPPPPMHYEYDSMTGMKKIYWYTKIIILIVSAIGASYYFTEKGQEYLLNKAYDVGINIYCENAGFFKKTFGPCE